ncbi:MAG TPA: MFS transporter, partial [Nitrospira sp.]|nr:MFS transporter [Nitrospira sp.]
MAKTTSPLRGLLIAQFCGAFNDNAWKLMVALLAIRQLASTMTPGSEFETASQTQTTLAFVVFTAPLALVSTVAGLLADRVSKRTIIILMKSVEMLLMSAATAALWINPAGGLLPLIVLGGMGVHSALFSPAKYGILAELLPHERLAAGNGQLEMWTFAAILTGTATPGILLSVTGDSTWLAPLPFALLSLIGFAAAWTIPLVPPARTEGGLLNTWQGAWTALTSDRLLRLAICGAVFFWTIASLFAQNILVYAKAVLGVSDWQSGLPLMMLSIGIGAGARLAGHLSQGRVEYGLIPLGAIGVTIILSTLGLVAPGFGWTLALMGILGLASALIFVPLNALIQWRAP